MVGNEDQASLTEAIRSVTGNITEFNPVPVEDRIIPADRCISWLEKNWITPKGKAFGIKDRDWIREYFRALNGYKAQARDKKKVCVECAALIGELLDFSDEVAHTVNHTPECAGLKACKIIFIFLDMDRRSGKSFTTLGFMAEQVFRIDNFRGRFCASGQDHSLSIAEDNLFKPVENNPQLVRYSTCRKSTKPQLLVPKRKSRIEIHPANSAAQLGGGLDIIFFDECKTISFETIVQALPSIQENHGFRCYGCKWELNTPTFEQIKRFEEEPTCPQCNQFVQRWWGRVVFGSNRGVISDDPLSDWFYLTVDQLLEDPDMNCHVIKMDDNYLANPDVNTEVKTAAVRVFGKSEELRPYLEVEFENESRRPGEPVFTSDEVAKIMTIPEGYLTHNPVLFFLDCSNVVDLTSLVGIEDVSADYDMKPMSKFKQCCIYKWDPQDPLCGVVNRSGPKPAIDDEKLEPRVIDILSEYPNIHGLWVDTRGNHGGLWGRKMVESLQNKYKLAWRDKVHSFFGGELENDVGWQRFIDLTATKMLELINDDRVATELKTAIWKARRKNGLVTYIVHDGTKSNSGEARRKKHLDVTKSIAILLYIAKHVDIQPTASQYRKLKGGSSLHSPQRSSNINSHPSMQQRESKKPGVSALAKKYGIDHLF